MKILNLFAGLGGNRQNWNGHSIISIEINPGVAKLYQELYPDDIVLNMDVFDYLREKENNLKDFDFIWASPPCQSHSHMQLFTRHNNNYPPIPRLDQTIGLIIWLNKFYNNKFVVENVIPWYGLIDLRFNNIFKVKLDRHIFYSNFKIQSKKFRSRGSEGHGKIGGLMRMKGSELCNFHNLDISIIDKLKGLQESGNDHLKVLRNLCNSELGDYILKQSLKENTLIKLLT